MTGSGYLGVFVRTEEEQTRWLGENIEGWRDLVATLDGVARLHRHTTYVSLNKSLQQEWAFVQCVTPGI